MGSGFKLKHMSQLRTHRCNFYAFKLPSNTTYLFQKAPPPTHTHTLKPALSAIKHIYELVCHNKHKWYKLRVCLLERPLLRTAFLYVNKVVMKNSPDNTSALPTTPATYNVYVCVRACVCVCVCVCVRECVYVCACMSTNVCLYNKRMI